MTAIGSFTPVPHHQASLKLLSAANKRKSACAMHALAEVYATMTALPVKDLIPPDQALLKCGIA